MYPLKSVNFLWKSLFFFLQNVVNCIKKYRFYSYPVRVGQLLCKNMGFVQNGVKCFKKYRFYKYPVKVGQFL